MLQAIIIQIVSSDIYAPSFKGSVGLDLINLVNGNVKCSSLLSFLA